MIAYILSGYDTQREKLTRTVETIPCWLPLLLVKSFRKLFIILPVPEGFMGQYLPHRTLVVIELKASKVSRHDFQRWKSLETFFSLLIDRYIDR